MNWNKIVIVPIVVILALSLFYPFVNVYAISFAQPADYSAYPSGMTPSNIVSGDFDGDGDMDVALTYSDTNNVGVMINQGNGIFGYPVLYSTVASGPTLITSVDLTNDNVLDLVVVTSNPDFMVFIGNGDGTFAAGSSFFDPSYSHPSSFVVGNFNSNVDSYPDIIIGYNNAVGISYGSGNFWFFYGQGDGTFSPASQSLPQLASGALSMDVGDFNQDSILDFSYTRLFSSQIYIALGNGNGSFQSAQGYSAMTGDKGEIKTAFLNNDAYPDIVVTKRYESGIVVALNDGFGNFSFSGLSGYSLPGTPATYLRLVDINNDAMIDIVTDGASPTGVVYFTGNGDGTFGSASTFSSYNSSRFVVDEFSHDNMKDLIMLRPYQGTGGLVSVYLGVLSADVTVTATVDPAISFSLSSTTCAISPTPDEVTGCSYDIAVSTNATSGYTIYISSDGDLTDGAHAMSNVLEDADQGSGYGYGYGGGSSTTILPGFEGYGIAVTGATSGASFGTSYIEEGDFSDDITPIPTASTPLFSVNTPTFAVSGTDLTTITHYLGISDVTPAGSYTQQVTYTVVGHF